MKSFVRAFIKIFKDPGQDFDFPHGSSRIITDLKNFLARIFKDLEGFSRIFKVLDKIFARSL